MYIDQQISARCPHPWTYWNGLARAGVLPNSTLISNPPIPQPLISQTSSGYGYVKPEADMDICLPDMFQTLQTDPTA